MKEYNSGIRCSVGECAYNEQNEYCDLDRISVGCSGTSHANNEDDTKCASFQGR